MALNARHWILAAGVGCAVVAVAYLPPTVPAAWVRALRWRETDPKAATAARAIEHLRTNVEHWLVLSERDSLTGAMRRRVPTKAGEATVIFREPVSRQVATRIDSLVQTAWRLVRGRNSGLSFRLVVYRASREVVTGPQDLRNAIGRGYTLLPQATDGRTCLAVAPSLALSDSSWARSWQRSEVRRQIENALAPCALYIAFGRPGAEIERWLLARNFRLARDASWAVGGNAGRSLEWTQAYLEFIESSRGRPAVLARLVGELPLGHDLPVDGTACMSGDLAACRVAALDTTSQDRSRGSWPRGTMIHSAGSFSFDSHLGGVASAFISDLIRDVGRERFQRFWQSDLSVEDAFRQVLGVSLEEWTHRWLVLRGGGTAIEAGVPIHLAPTLVGLLCSGLLVGAAALGAQKRQVE